MIRTLVTVLKRLRRGRNGWVLEHCVPRDELHVAPVCDLVPHELYGDDCVCGPRVVFLDPETGETWASGLIQVVHHALDGRD